MQTTCRALFIVLALSGCAQRYIPQLTLPPSRSTIDAVAEVHPFHAADPLHSGHEPYGVQASRVKQAVPSVLTEQITAAFIEDLDTNAVFRRVTTFASSPDVVLTGRIDKFVEHYRPKLWTFAPGMQTFAWLFNLNTYVSSGEVHLRVVALTPSGKLIGQYVGRARFDEDFTPTGEVPPGARLNRAFSEAMQDIRDAMLSHRSWPNNDGGR